MWLQGGFGVFFIGYGNFVEIGFLDIDFKLCNIMWIKEVNIVFVDNFVGCGYSYVIDLLVFIMNILGMQGFLF